MYNNICSYHNAYVFSCCLASFVNLTPSCFSSIFVVAIYGHLLCPPLLSTTSILLWPKQLYHVSHYLGSHCLAFGLQTPYGWCQTILNIFFVKLLREFLIKYILSYHLLWHSIFCLHHGCRFVCARIKYFLTIAFYSCFIFSIPISQKIEET
jgi:hypothetical protein